MGLTWPSDAKCLRVADPGSKPEDSDTFACLSNKFGFKLVYPSLTTAESRARGRNVPGVCNVRGCRSPAHPTKAYRMSKATKLQALYDAIPAFDCIPGCSDCCGPVPMTKAEWQRIELVPRSVGKGCLDCAYLVDSKCAVYADRPFLCRLFGATTASGMVCPHGRGPETPLTPQQAHKLTERYRKLVGEAVYLTGELPNG